MLIGSRDFAHGTDHYYKGGDSRRVQTESRLHSKQQQGTRSREMPRGLTTSSEDHAEAYVQKLTSRTSKYNVKASEAATEQQNKKVRARERLVLKLIERKAAKQAEDK